MSFMSNSEHILYLPEWSWLLLFSESFNLNFLKKYLLFSNQILLYYIFKFFHIRNLIL